MAVVCLPVTYLALGRELTEYQAENWQKEAHDTGDP